VNISATDEGHTRAVDSRCSHRVPPLVHRGYGPPARDGTGRHFLRGETSNVVGGEKGSHYRRYRAAPMGPHQRSIGEDPRIADSIMDRLVPNCYRMELGGESVRKKRGRNRVAPARRFLTIGRARHPARHAAKIRDLTESQRRDTVPVMPEADHRDRPAGEGKSRTARMHIFEESDSGTVPMNHSNKSGKPPAESEEGRPLIKENIHQSSTPSTQSGVRVSQGLAGVRRAARERKEMKFTALLHHLTVALLRDSFYALKRKAAPGVDGITWQEYETGLEGRLAELHSRVHRGAYRAQPSRRVYIPKPDGRQRPLGVAALEDKMVQQAVVTILNQIYEKDFRGFSYGFRPGRSQHQALDALYVAMTRKKVNWILDCDIRGFFDNLSHDWLIRFVQHRVADRRILRLIQKWLKAGVMEEGEWKNTEMGTPQGSVATA
jgi:Reverse transcriptase (RNA-dependent DNA polymerase)